jgi:hypothetical protein
MGITKMTGGAFIRKHHPRMVFPCVHGQYFGGTEFHTDAAAFAPGGIYDDQAAWAFFDRSRWDRRWRKRRNIGHERTFRVTGFANYPEKWREGGVGNAVTRTPSTSINLGRMCLFYYKKYSLRDEEHPLSLITDRVFWQLT